MMHAAVRRTIRRTSESRRKAANLRWERHRERLNRLDEKDPIQVGGKIVERLVRIIDESWVIERTFYEYDRPCDWRRKRRDVFKCR